MSRLYVSETTLPEVGLFLAAPPLDPYSIYN